MTWKTPETTASSLQAAIDRFELGRRVRRFRDLASSRFDPDCSVWIQEGDLAIDGDLRLDWEDKASWGSHCGLIVNGNLDVRRTLMNDDYDGGPFLVVLGSLRAQHLVAGGSTMFVAGDAEIEGLLLGHYNHGVFEALGTTRARLVIGDDHDLRVDTTSPFWNSQQDPSGMPLSEYLHVDIEVSRDEDYDPNLQEVESATLIERLLAGLPVLRAADDPRPRKDARAWLAKIEKSPRALKYVPRELIDAEMAHRAVSRMGFALQFVPPELKTPELCDAAMADSVAAYPFVPEPLRKEEWSLAVVQSGGEYLQYVPRPFRTREVCRWAIEDDGSALFEVPDEIWTPDLDTLAVRRQPWRMRELPKERLSVEVAVEAVRKLESFTSDVPEEIREEVLKRVEELGPLPEDLSRLPRSPADRPRFDTEIKEIFSYSRRWFVGKLEEIRQEVEKLRSGLREEDWLAVIMAGQSIQHFGSRLIPIDVRERIKRLEQTMKDQRFDDAAVLAWEIEKDLKRVDAELQATLERW